MKCPSCNGYGRTQYFDHPCIRCGGTGEITLTNEEWFCQLSITEKSEFLSAMVKQAIKVYEIHGCTWHETVSWWDSWLKEKHHD